MRIAVLSMLLMVACDDDSDGKSDTGEAVEDDDGAPEPCQVVELEALGPDAPVVGDSWTLWLRCDGATLAGWGVYTVDPIGLAEFEDNVATFQESGSGTLTVQNGTYSDSIEVTVLP